MLGFLLSWDIEGAVYGIKCGEIESGAALVFEKEGRRRVCTPYLDTTSYGNLRFYFTMGMEIIHLPYFAIYLALRNSGFPSSPCCVKSLRCLHICILTKWFMMLCRWWWLWSRRVTWEWCDSVWKVWGQEGTRCARYSSILCLQGEIKHPSCRWTDTNSWLLLSHYVSHGDMLNIFTSCQCSIQIDLIRGVTASLTMNSTALVWNVPTWAERLHCKIKSLLQNHHKIAIYQFVAAHGKKINFFFNMCPVVWWG